MKRLLGTIVAVVSLVPGLALAVDAAPKSVSSSPSPQASSYLPTPTPVRGKVAASEQAAHLTNLKTRGTAEIARRLVSLAAATTALNADAKLSATSKTTLNSQLKSESDGLTALGAKLSSDTTLDAARIDVQSIITGYRAYALMIPKVRLVAAADNFTVVGEKLNLIAHSLQANINAIKASGKDVVTAQSDLSSMEDQLNTARLAYTGLSDKVIALDPADYNANHQVLSSDRQTLESARSSIKSARAGVDTVIAALKAAK
jgi:hypothetical protein